MNVEIGHLGFVFQLISMVVSVVWVISAIKTTTAVLNNTIINLSHTINKLETTLNKIEQQYVDHEIRITRLEDQVATADDNHTKRIRND